VPFVGNNVTTVSNTGKLQTASSGAGITIDGAAPAITISDGFSNRIQHGNLSQYTDPNGHVSPQGYGGRVVDQSGNLLWDASGLIGVMQSGGFAANATSQALAGTGASNWTDITGSSFTLTLTRPTRIKYDIHAAAQVTTGTGKGYVRGNIVGFDTSASVIFGTSVSTGFIWYVAMPGGSFIVTPAGTYTVKLQLAADNSSTITMSQYFHQIFVLGS